MNADASIAFAFVALYLLTFFIGGLTGSLATFLSLRGPHQAQLGKAYDAGYAAGHEDAEDDLLDKADELFNRMVEPEDDGHA